jgi:hypothetical protein
MAQFLSSTEQFVQLKLSVAELRKTPALMRTLRDFRAAIAEVSSEEQMDRLDREYKRLEQIPELRRYFHASDRYGELFAIVTNDVNMMLEQVLGL